MTTTANPLTEHNIEHEKFDAERLKRRVRRYKKIVKFTCLGLGIFSMLLMAFLPIAYFFIGTSKFFTLTFSLPDFVDWLNSLPYVKIVDPEGQLTRLIIGLLFFIVYVFISVILIKNLIRTIKKFVSLCDLKNTHIDHKELFLDMIQYTTTAYTAVLCFGLLSLSATTGRMQPIVLALLILYGIFFIVITLAKNIYVCYNFKQSKFYKNAFSLNIVKNFFLVIVSSLLLTLCLDPQIPLFVDGIIENYRNSTNFTGVTAINKYVFPWIKWILILFALSTFKQTIKINVLMLKKPGSSNLYGQSYQVDLSENATLQAKIKNNTIGIFIFGILSFILQVLFACFNSANKFVSPENFGDLFKQSAFVYAPILLLAVAATWIAKTKETHPLTKKN